MCQILKCNKCYYIGNTEESGELQLYLVIINKNSRNPIGNSMFLLKALLPCSIVSYYSKIRGLVNLRAIIRVCIFVSKRR
ncbi:DUF3023 domain-containing protein [Ehrlichia canis]|uniref:Uncharacterized protein n=1 Tax=Ehrlichia canis (strain Jake) TaxID=269484 RepID=A0ACA6AVT6_EHRCJ|nr:DUF3023 domain-containing protein [Ehrlichia canis]AAZ68467.1 hypothetical protein Ecaj_0425 [Ehrlichia canis str. Jake]AUO54783.1 DUF3023 domain-containing protein [Ehrlichia canis]UKC53849.1 DUF3023 domain-containing protein [Ehrlichia canis]UKC54785.1 DUF3023 domain-containing protein [Ehrlichia canis]UKC55721.1 DUF3023 domain-containing protein [Ehrlichia canis]